MTDVVILVNDALSVGTIALKCWAFADAAIRPAAAYKAVDKLPKAFWLTVLGLGALGHIALALNGLAGSWMHIVGLAGIVAALIYFFGIRPLVMQYGGRRKGRGRPSPDSSW